MPNCDSCGAAVQFVPSAATGKLMCLNAEASEKGNIVIQKGKAIVIRRDLFYLADGFDVPRYLDHHADCPNAKAHRRKKK